MELKHEATFGQTNIGALCLRQFGSWLAADDNLAFGRRIEQAEQIEQRRFSGSRRSGDGEKFTLRHAQVDAIDQGMRDNALNAADQSHNLERDLAQDAPRIISTGCTRVALRAGKKAATAQQRIEMAPEAI